MRFTFKSFDAFPANSSTSAVRYSRMAALYTAVYLNKGLNTLHNIKTEGKEKTKDQFVTSHGIGQLLLVKPQVLQLAT